MALSVDPTTFVITIPKADLTLIQSTPTEIRELDLNAFRLELKAWEWEGSNLNPGITFLKTHVHNTEVSLGGLTFARVIEILDPYSITFEDGQYAVNLVGANSNVGDKVNVNQVSVRSQNSAGLISSPAIEFASFNGGVIIDVINGTTGTVFPKGTEQAPVNNLTDALLIAQYRGFAKLYVYSDLDIDGDVDLSNFNIVGRNHVNTSIEIFDQADVLGVSFENSLVTGVLDGGNSFEGCVVGDITFFYGHIHNSSLAGTITLAGAEDAYIVNCSRLDVNIIPIINMGGSGQDLVMPNYAGAIRIENLTGASKAGIGLNSGTVMLDSTTVTAGNITVSGVGRLVDESGNPILSGTWNGGVTITNNLISKETIGTAVWDEPLTAANHNIPTSAGRRLRDTSSSVIHTGETLSATDNTISFNGDASSVDGAYDPALISIINGTGFGQTRLILEYKGSTKTAVVDRNWKVTPDVTSEYAIVSHPGREHINEGLAQGGTINTITLNALASPSDNEYVGQVVSIRSGTGEDQACRIIAYNGTTKIATVARDWNIIPNATSAYVMLPTGVLDTVRLKAGIADSVWDEDLTTHTTADSAGKILQDTKRDVGDAQALILAI